MGREDMRVIEGGSEVCLALRLQRVSELLCHLVTKVAPKYLYRVDLCRQAFPRVVVI